VLRSDLAADVIPVQGDEVMGKDERQHERLLRILEEKSSHFENAPQTVDCSILKISDQ